MDVSWLQLALVNLVFVAPPAAIYLYLIGREIGRLRREAAALKQELGGYAADGYPPPGPPTTDSLSDNGDTLEPPPTAEPR